MAGVQEKKKRITEKSTFSRSVNKFNKLIDAAASLSLVTEHFEKVKNCYERLETAHNDFLMATDIDIENDPSGLEYMNDPDKKYEEILESFTIFQKAAEKDQAESHKTHAAETLQLEKIARAETEDQERAAAEAKRKDEVSRQFDCEKAGFSTSIAAFKRMTLNVRDSLKDISPADKRGEWSKVEKDFSTLKQQLTKIVAIDPTLDSTEVCTLFEEDAEKVFHEAQSVVLTALKDVPLTSGGVASLSASSSVKLSVRKEAVPLPNFEGDPKSSPSPFLEYPGWKSRWEVVIAGYDEEHKIIMLHNHLDEHAKSKYIGYEKDYDKCMERLDKFYGDPIKLVGCIMQEVNSQGEIVEGDYNGLLQYSVVLENNFNHLTGMGHQHEMSNTSAMTSILRKFPLNIAERWHDFLALQEEDEKVKPFPLLIK